MSKTIASYRLDLFKIRIRKGETAAQLKLAKDLVNAIQREYNGLVLDEQSIENILERLGYTE